MTAPTKSPAVRRVLRVSGAACALALLAACAGPDRMHTPGVADYRQAYPIRAEMKTFSATLSITSVLDHDQRLPTDFVNAYRRRGRGPVNVVVPEDAASRGMEAAKAIGWWLDSQGIEAVALRSPPGMGAGHAARGEALTVFFKGYVALVSDCGDWTGETGFNPTNMPHTNFGCAYQRNIGMMLADPGDLVDPRDLGPYSGYRAATIIGKWYAGEFTGAEPPPNEGGTVSDVIDTTGE